MCLMAEIINPWRRDSSPCAIQITSGGGHCSATWAHRLASLSRSSHLTKHPFLHLSLHLSAVQIKADLDRECSRVDVIIDHFKFEWTRWKGADCLEMLRRDAAEGREVDQSTDLHMNRPDPNLSARDITAHHLLGCFSHKLASANAAQPFSDGYCALLKRR